MPVAAALSVSEPDDALAAELAQALETMSADRQADAARRIAELFLAGASQFNARHVELFDRALGPLIEVLPTDARAGLARSLTMLHNAPPGVLRRLAGDASIAVAGPVLTRSSLLADADLAAIASTASQGHLFAISGRAGLGTIVTDVLVDCGDRDVVRNLAMNCGAELSRSGLAMLLARAVNDGVLAEKLARRPDVPAQGLRGLAGAASDDVRLRLLAAVPDEIKAELAAIEPAPDANETAAHVEAWRVARALNRAGQLDEAQVLEFARSARVREMIAALALICGLSTDIVRQLLSAEQPDAALVLCQAAGFSLPTTRVVVQAASRRAIETINATLAQFDRLSPATAQGMIGIWRGYQQAA